MSDFRKNMHVQFKKQLSGIMLSYSIEMIENIEEFAKEPEQFIADWINRNCLPMGDFNEEDAIKEIKEWNK